MPVLGPRTNAYLRQQSRFLFTVVGIPLACLAPLLLILLYVLGGADLLRFTFNKLMTGTSIRRVAIVIGVLTLVTWVRHAVWYQDEEPPLWFRRSVWLNMVEALILLTIIMLGIWAFYGFASPPLPPG